MEYSDSGEKLQRERVSALQPAGLLASCTQGCLLPAARRAACFLQPAGLLVSCTRGAACFPQPAGPLFLQPAGLLALRRPPRYQHAAVGVYGLGRFGSFWAELLTRVCEVRVYSRDPGSPPAARHHASAGG
ncbi:MAG: hypothetical protein MZV64_28600 [Ignavibacteriales bacterium]|nr:hypothetical protein [Ignavibacteriales bacterium]